MRKLIFSFLVVLVSAFPLISQGGDQAVNAKPAVYAVMMHADWCGACNALAPKISQAQESVKLDGENVQFVKLDLTNESTKQHAKTVASEMGFSEAYKDNGGKTGYMLLINASTGEKLAKITNKLNAETIVARINKTIKSVKS